MMMMIMMIIMMMSTLWHTLLYSRKAVAVETIAHRVVASRRPAYSVGPAYRCTYIHTADSSALH